MAGFLVVDLIGQAPAIERHVRGWPPDAVVAWLRQFGQVVPLPLGGGREAFLFEGPSGLQAAFWFTADGHLAIGPLEY